MKDEDLDNDPEIHSLHLRTGLQKMPRVIPAGACGRPAEGTLTAWVPPGPLACPTEFWGRDQPAPLSE